MSIVETLKPQKKSPVSLFEPLSPEALAKLDEITREDYIDALARYTEAQELYQKAYDRSLKTAPNDDGAERERIGRRILRDQAVKDLGRLVGHRSIN